MAQTLEYLGVLSLIAPLLGSIVAGCFGKKVGRSGAHWVTIIGVAIAFICSVWIFKILIIDGAAPLNTALYTWGVSGSFSFDVGIFAFNVGYYL